MEPKIVALIMGALQEVETAKVLAGRSEVGRKLAVTATHLETALLWARHAGTVEEDRID